MRSKITKITKRSAYLLIAVAVILAGSLYWLTNRGHALTLVTTCNATANSIASCTGVASGDLLVVFAFRSGNATAPTKPATFTQIAAAITNSGAGTNNSANSGWKIAASSNEGSNTWTNASNILMHVYRGVNASSPVGNTATQGGNNSGKTVTYGNATTALSVTDGTSWWVGFAGRNAADAKMATAPTGMVNESSNPATPVVGGHDTNGGTSSSWTATSVTGFGTAAKYVSLLVEIKNVPNSPPNAPTLSTPSSGATGVSVTPSFTLSTTDPDGDAVKYRLYLYQSDCTTAISGSPFDQATSGTGWDNGTTAYTSGATATYTYQSTLSYSTTYCWKADAIDPSGSNTYGSASATQSFTTLANSPPGAPALSSPASGATNVSVIPSFTMSATDTNGDTIKYRLYLYLSDCSTPVGSSPFAQATTPTGWDNGSTAYASGATATYTYQGSLANSTTYCWKADAIDPSGSNTYGSASSTQLFTTAASAQVNVNGGVNINGGTNVQ